MIAMDALQQDLWDDLSPEQFDNEAFGEILDAFDGRAGGRSIKDLALFARVSKNMLWRSYASKRSFESIRAIVEAAAFLLRLDVRALALHAFGEPQAEIRQHLRLLASHRCAVCGEAPEFALHGKWVAKKNMHECCVRVRETPRMMEWMLATDANIHRAPKDIRDAWKQARKGTRRINLPLIAQIAGCDVSEVQRVWVGCGLPPRPARGLKVVYDFTPRRYEPLTEAAIKLSTRPGRSSR